MNDKISIGNRIKSVMEEKGLTQAALQRLCEPLFTDDNRFSKGMLSFYVRGIQKPNDDRLKVLAEALDVAYDWLMSGEDTFSEKEDAPLVEKAEEPIEEPIEESIEEAAEETAEEAADEAAESPAEPAEAPAENPPVSSELDSVVLQYEGIDYVLSDLSKRCIDAWQTEQGKEGEGPDSFQMYLKPEEHKVYFVVNGYDTGSVDF